MSAIIFVEGGGSGDLRVRCREGFQILLQKMGFTGRKPKVVPCGSRNAAFDDFQMEHKSARLGHYVGLWVDSEDPVGHISKPWEHLLQRDGWAKPPGATDEQVLLMATCMETWIISDHEALTDHYGSKLQFSALPALIDLENRSRHAVQDALLRATRNCPNAYAKGKRSFEVLAELDPATLEKHLPSFVRIRDILKSKL